MLAFVDRNREIEEIPEGLETGFTKRTQAREVQGQAFRRSRAARVSILQEINIREAKTPEEAMRMYTKLIDARPD